MKAASSISLDSQDNTDLSLPAANADGGNNSQQTATPLVKRLNTPSTASLDSSRSSSAPDLDTDSRSSSPAAIAQEVSSADNFGRESRFATLAARTSALAIGAGRVGFHEALSLPVKVKFSGNVLPPSPFVRSGTQKILRNLHKIPEITKSHYWESMKQPHRELHRGLCQEFIDNGEPLECRVRVDSVVKGIDAEGNLHAGPVEYEFHSGGDFAIHITQKVFEAARLGSAEYLDTFAADVLKRAPNQSGKLRVMNWPADERDDHSYHGTVEAWLDQMRLRGVDAQQFNYNDESADWEGALVYPMFELSELDHCQYQQGMLEKHRAGEIKIETPLVPFGKIIPLLVTEFPEAFAERAGMTSQEIESIPHTFSASKYLSSPELREKYSFSTMYLKGVYSSGGSGSIDVHRLAKRGSTWPEVERFIHETIDDDPIGGWIVQNEIPRATFETVSADEDKSLMPTQLTINSSARYLQRQEFIGTEAQTCYNVSTPLGDDGSTIHVTSGSALSLYDPSSYSADLLPSIVTNPMGSEPLKWEENHLRSATLVKKFYSMDSESSQKKGAASSADRYVERLMSMDSEPSDKLT